VNFFFSLALLARTPHRHSRAPAIQHSNNERSETPLAVSRHPNPPHTNQHKYSTNPQNTNPQNHPHHHKKPTPKSKNQPKIPPKKHPQKNTKQTKKYQKRPKPGNINPFNSKTTQQQTIPHNP